MNPKADAEKIRFCREADSRYCLVHEGSFGGSSNLFYIVRLVEQELGLKLEREGYCGHGGYSSQTLQSDQPINVRVFGWKVRRLLGLPLKELASIVRDRHLLGPKPGESGFGKLDGRTSAAALKAWSVNYYEANSIDCPGSLAVLERNSLFRWRRVSIDFLLHNLGENFQTPLKVEVYRQLLESGVTLPPLICRRRGWDLFEGYHRLAAYQQAGSAEVPCVVIGKA